LLANLYCGRTRLLWRVVRRVMGRVVSGVVEKQASLAESTAPGGSHVRAGRRC